MSNQFKDPLDNIIKESINSPITYPSELEIDKTINTLKQYMPSEGCIESNKKNFDLYKKIKKDLSMVNGFYWYFNLALYVIGFILTLTSKNPYITISFYSPIPFIIIFFEDIKGRDPQILEMELACKNTVQTIMLTRITITAFYNLLLMSIISAIIYFIIPTITLFNLLITWLTPIILVNNITLFIIKRIRTSYILSSIILVWIGVIVWVMNTPNVIESLYTINYSIYIGFILIGILLLVFQLKAYIKKNSERSILFGT
ncbi:hypothetical protein SH1V18_47240 [Vallitalea longa]|uniref:Uncharacterized protein n=1 Tax=Vallitalea longa TaxID=2936439 RepID=A0A9W5YHX7_9FIRM|nr:hypothetical protein [Vallitalea longa]GKX32244.1 hypothetical protein SH1V18_47240 [Vallitalea longa]